MKWGLVLLGALLLAGGASAADGQRFSVMTWNLSRYTLADRDGDGAVDDPKPEAERRAVQALVVAERPEVLAVQEMGNATLFAQFQAELRAAGLHYPYAELLPQGRDLNLAVLSQFPIVAVHHHTNDWYSIGEQRLPVLRGFLDVEIEVHAHYRFRLLTAHLKSKVYHALGQTEMRRNEARLLNKAIRGILDADPTANLLVAGDFNDDFNSVPVREVSGRRGGPMTDLRPVDGAGEVWTFFWAEADTYSRLDYFFVSQGMLPETVRHLTRAVDDPSARNASDHRPLVAVFEAVDQ
jgi:endonuclease/exonuclease/phosphatase family metal-dependent hydrolase